MGKYALLIGVGEYGEGLTPLPAAPRDVVAFAEVLQNPQMGGFDEVKPVINPNQAEMAREIELWFRGREPDDLVLLFFSGHGVKDNDRKLFFAACNTEKQRDDLISSTATSAQFIHDRIRRCRAKYQVIILDCCYSGAFGDFLARDDGEINLKEQLGAEGCVVLTATNAVDYAYEEKGADLSIYTRYLVEGIASGAADEDEDGVITVEELHRFAGRKVEATSPAMSPKIITLKDEGYRIRLARSPQDDPKVKYRKEAERRAESGQFSIPARRMLLSLRQKLGILDIEAEAIEAEVLKPFQEYQRKRQEYEETLRQCLQAEATLSPNVIRDLMDFRNHLGLKLEDVDSIEQAALAGKNLVDYIAVLNRQEQEVHGKDDDSEEIASPLEVTHPALPPPEVDRKELSECDPSKILFIKNIRDPNGGWAYTLDHIQHIGGSVESRVFELFWSPSGRGMRSASKGNLMLLNQQAKITHVVEMLDDDVRRNSAGYFRWVRVVWMPEESDWSKLPHQRDVIGFEPPTIGGGTAYWLANLSKFQKAWNSLEVFQQHVFQLLTGAKSLNAEVNDVDDLSSERFGANYYAKLGDLLAVQDWKAADQETANRMLEVMDRQKEGWLRAEDIEDFPCLDLRNIDSLWVKYSQGKFGFSVQKQIWQVHVSSNGKGWKEFCVTVGWRTKGIPVLWNAIWVPHELLTFNELAPEGHLPREWVEGSFNQRFLLNFDIGWKKFHFLFSRQDL